ncbi:MAG: acyl-CoA thioesterase [Candidatus Saccharibacteria bacterium]
MEETLQGKTIAESATTIAQVILPSMTNPAGTAHGGELMKMMDNAAGVCATRHSRAIVVTADIDEINFHEPVFMGNLATCHAHLSYVGKSSMEIMVNIDAEDLLTGDKRCCVTAYFVFVALDKDFKPVQLEPLILQNEFEKKVFEEAKERMRQRKERPKLCWTSFY